MPGWLPQATQQTKGQGQYSIRSTIRAAFSPHTALALLGFSTTTKEEVPKNKLGKVGSPWILLLADGPATNRRRQQQDTRRARRDS